MEANRKRVQVHMLPTNGKDIAMLSKRVKDGMLQSANGTEGVANCNTMWQPQHLYFTTDEEIKEGDWMMNLNGDKIYQHFGNGGDFEQWNKIIATTDPKLTVHWEGHEYGTAREISAEVYLPQPSQAFIKAYCEQGGFDEVDVEYVEMITCKLCNKSEEECSDNFTCEGNMIGEDILKVDPIHNTITTHRIVEKMYSIDDIEAYCDKYPNDTELGREIRKLRYRQ